MNTILDWGVAMQKLAGETESGDRYLVRSFPYGMLVAVIDGLGHGSLAAKAARVAIDTLAASPQESLIYLVEQSHRILKNTRGAVMGLASFNFISNTMSWLAVGNVEGVMLYPGPGSRPSGKSLLNRSGIVGLNLPQLHVTTIPVASGDTLIIASDGINYNFARGLTLNNSPQQMADHIIAHHAKDTDDAIVLVARYLGG